MCSYRDNLNYIIGRGRKEALEKIRHRRHITASKTAYTQGRGTIKDIKIKKYIVF